MPSPNLPPLILRLGCMLGGHRRTAPTHRARAKRQRFLEPLEERRLLASSVDANSPWEPFDAESLFGDPQRSYIRAPDYAAFALDRETFAAEISELRADSESANTHSIALPLPDGTSEQFTLVASPVMAPELAEKFPEIVTYSGQGVDNPTATLRLDLTPAGLHAQVLSPSGSYYIDPILHLDDRYYASYRANQLVTPPWFEELLESRDGHLAKPNAMAADANEVAGATATDGFPAGAATGNSGTELRVLRTAISAVGDYTSFHGGTVAQGLAAVVTAVNRVTGIYERDLAIRLELVANNDQLIFTNAATDPFSDGDPVSLRFQNQMTIDATIGTANYDVGHVFATEGGGLASLGVAGIEGVKAQATSGIFPPTGDQFFVDFFAHELGHQFGARHTWSGDSGACGTQEYSQGTAFEPGSGSTIMAYAGICGNDNLQSSTDAFFHSNSFEQILDHIENAIPTVGSRIPTGNNLPVVDAFHDFTIPARTPFALTAIGSDADVADVLTYSWEQRDVGPQRDLDAGDDGQSPLFRVWPPAQDPTRVFPRLSDLVSNTTAPGETLPTTTRTMNFRVVARDNRAGGGGAAWDDMVVNVVDTGSSFQLTSFNQGATVPARSLRAVTWNVAGTTANNIDVEFVNILASVDGGLTFSHPLAMGTPNDGVEEIVIPDVSSSQVRLKVEAVDNVFFDISDANITIADPVPGIVAIATAGSTDISEAGKTDQYDIVLNSTPTGAVTVRVTAPPKVEVSLDGQNYSDTLDLQFADAAPQTVIVRAVDDQEFEGVERAALTHTVISTLDLANYPMTLRINDLALRVADNELAQFQRVEPLGGLVSLSVNDSFLSNGSAPQDFSLFIDSGQVVSAVVEPIGPTSLTVELIGVSATFSSASPGAAVVLPPTAVSDSGLHTVRVTGSDAASFRLTQYRNVSLESQLGDTADGNELDITSSFVPLGSGRFGVLGEFAGADQGDEFEFRQSNNPDLFVDIAATGSALNLGDEQETPITTTIGNAILPSGTLTVANNGVLLAGDLFDVPFINETLPTRAFDRAIVPFWDDLAGGPGNVFWEERQIDGINALVVQWDDRQHFDFGGRVTFQVQLFETGPILARYVYPDIEFGTAQADGGASATIGYQDNENVAQQFSRNTAAVSNGDVLELAAPVTAEVDEYTVDLTGRIGRTIDIVLDGRDGTDFSDQVLELVSTDGTTVLAAGSADPLSTGTNTTNYELGILDFVVPADGIYTIRATSTVDGRYGILIADDLSFDTEPNNLASDPLRQLAATNGGLGFLDVANDDADYYEIDLQFGDQLIVATDTPPLPLNDLNPELEVLHPDGSTVLGVDQDSAPDGKNATVTVSAAVAGTYLVRVAATSGSGEYRVSANVIDEPSLSISALVPTSTGFRADFNLELDPSSLNLFDTETGGLGPADVVLTGASVGPVAGSLLVGADLRSVQFVKTGGPLAADTYSLNMRSAADGFKAALGALLDGNGDGTAGDDFATEITVAAQAARTLSLPDIVRGPGQTVSLPADSTLGLPLTISDGTNVRAIDLRIGYDSSLLEITGATVAAGMPAGATVTIDRGTPGLAALAFSSPTALAQGTQSFIHLEASVPANSAASIYGRSQILDVHAVTVSDGDAVEFATVDDDSLHLASFFADVSLNGRVNAADAVQVARIAALLDTGFGGLSLVDPSVVGDITGDGRISAVDASLVAQFAALFPVPEIPPIPPAGGVAVFGSAVSIPSRSPSPHPGVTNDWRPEVRLVDGAPPERGSSIDDLIGDDESWSELFTELDPERSADFDSTLAALVR